MEAREWTQLAPSLQVTEWECFLPEDPALHGWSPSPVSLWISVTTPSICSSDLGLLLALRALRMLPNLPLTSFLLTCC